MGTPMRTEDVLRQFGVMPISEANGITVFSVPTTEEWEITAKELSFTLDSERAEVLFYKEHSQWQVQICYKRGIWIPIELSLVGGGFSLPCNALDYLQAYNFPSLKFQGNYVLLEVTGKWKIEGDTEPNENPRAITYGAFRIDFFCDTGAWYMTITGRKVN